MRSDLRLKLLGVVAIGLPAVALAWSAGPSTAIAAGLAAVLLAAGLVVSPLGPRTSELPEVDEAIEALEDEIEAVQTARATVLRGAETAGRFRDEFVAAVRHELKTPLNAILGFADVLLQEVDGPLTEQQREDVDAIRGGGIYLRELVEAVLAEWRPQRDTPLPMSIIDVRKLLEHAVRILEGQARGRPVELRVVLPEPVRGPLADERRLLQVLINLGTNALRATEQGQVTFSARDAAEYICLSVSDTGEGIDPDALGTIFQRFERGHGRSEGSGLGLTIAREMVEWHGGYIEIETQRGQGTVFSVMIPKELR